MPVVESECGKIDRMYKPAQYPVDEPERLAALRKYRILDTAPEPQFDRIVTIARRHFDVPVALVTFVDADRLYLKARGDFAASEAPRDVSFCSHTILDENVLVVGDAEKDDRFRDNPLVTEAPNFRFYAGAPLTTPDGYRIGTVCLFDVKPRRDFDAADRQKLEDFAAIVTDHLEMRLAAGNVYDEIVTRRAAEAAARRLAYYDPLTGLPNRAHLQNVVDTGLPFEPQGMLAAFQIDIDDFKAVNDTFGHRAADGLLKQMAKTIETVLGPSTFVARVGGDEFVAILDGTGRTEIEAVAARLIEAAMVTVSLNGHMIATSVSVGLAFAEFDEPDLELMLRNAGLALTEAKRAGRKRFSVFDRKMAIAAGRRRRLERDLPAALETGAITVLYQPIHRAADRAMLGLEALARWHHPELGYVSPVEFVPLAEESGHILDLGQHILRSALSAALGWEQLFVSVNLSPVQFRLADLAGTIAATLKETGFPPERLQLEVTEGILVHDMAAARRQIEALHELGVAVSLDDFGTGYSSLSYLRSLPFDKVKIDRSFVIGVSVDETRYAIIRCIVALARELRMGVTAEGVETEDEAVLLAAAGCTSLQGYYFGHPATAEEISRRPEIKRRAA